MKNILNIDNGIPTLLSNVDDGTNTLYINDELVPSSEWTGTGYYTFTSGGLTFTIQKIRDDSGNIMFRIAYYFLDFLPSDDNNVKKIAYAASFGVDDWEFSEEDTKEIIVLKKLKQHNKKIILFNLFGYYDPMLEMLDFMLKEGVVREEIDKNTFKIADTLERVFELLERG
mgnify:CR=1 FL=1